MAELAVLQGQTPSRDLGSAVELDSPASPDQDAPMAFSTPEQDQGPRQDGSQAYDPRSYVWNTSDEVSFEISLNLDSMSQSGEATEASETTPTTSLTENSEAVTRSSPIEM